MCLGQSMGCCVKYPLLVKWCRIAVVTQVRIVYAEKGAYRELLLCFNVVGCGA